MADPNVLQILTSVADAAVMRALGKAPGVRLRPGTLVSDAGYPSTSSGDIGVAEVPASVVAGIRLDGDSGLTYAQNITGEPFGLGTRVMCAFVPPMACFILGPIDNWPVERGLISEVDYPVSTNPTTTSATLVEIDTNLRFAFTVPASGRVRLKVVGGMIGTSGNDEPGFGFLASSGASVDTYFAGGDSTQRMGNWGEYNPTVYDRVASGLPPGEVLQWTPAFRRIVGTATATIAIWYGGPGSIRIEVWGMPPQPSLSFV